jgi:hypothetical protein
MCAGVRPLTRVVRQYGGAVRKQLVVALVLFGELAHGECLRVKVDAFARDLADAHAASAYPALIKKYGEVSSFVLFIEHSIPVDREYEISRLQGLSQLQAVLEARRTEGRPKPESRPLTRCDNNLCRYSFREGIQHGTIYLKEFRYRLDNNCLSIDSVWLLDGD